MSRTSPVDYIAHNGLPEGNPCTSDTKDEVISTSLMSKSIKRLRFSFTKKEGHTQLLFLLCNKMRNEILSDKVLLQARTAPTLNLEDQVSTNPNDSVCNPYFPGTKSLLSTLELLPNLLKCCLEPPSAKLGLREFIQVDLSTVHTRLPGG